MAKVPVLLNVHSLLISTGTIISAIESTQLKWEKIDDICKDNFGFILNNLKYYTLLFVMVKGAKF